jgi:hypothetical protein
MTYASLGQIKSALAISSTDSVDDETLMLALSAASEQIDAYCGRTFSETGVTEVRYFASYKSDQVEVDDMDGAPTEFAYSSNGNGVYDSTIDLGNLALLPSNGSVDGLRWPTTAVRVLTTENLPVSRNGEPTVAITATWGFGYVPTSVVRACIAQASRLHARNLSPYGVAGFGDMGVVRLAQGLDVDVQQLLTPYCKIRGNL